MCGEHVGIKLKFLVVCVFVGPVSLVANCFHSDMGGAYLVYHVEQAQRGECNKDQYNGRKDGSNNFDLLGV